MWRGWFCSCFLPQIVFLSPISSLFILPLSFSLTLSLSCLLDTAGIHVCRDGLDWESVRLKEVSPRIWMIGMRKGGRGMWQREWPRIVETPPTPFLKRTFSWHWLGGVSAPRSYRCGSRIVLFILATECTRVLSFFNQRQVCGLRLARYLCLVTAKYCRSKGPRGLRHGSAAACLLGLWVRIPPAACMSVVSVVCCQVEVCTWCRPVVQRSPTEWCVCVWVWWWNLDNEKALDH